MGVEEHEQVVADDAGSLVVQLAAMSEQQHAQGLDVAGVPVFDTHLLAVAVEPVDVIESIGAAALEEVAAGEGGLLGTDGDEALGELQQAAGLFSIGPVDPREVVVLRIAVVVSLGGVPNFVASEQHGDTLGNQQGGQQVAHLSAAEFDNLGVVAGAFDAAVPAEIVVAAIAIGLAIGLVVLGVVADEIAEAEAVVAGDEVDAGRGAASIVLVQVGAAGEPGCQLGDGSAVPFPVAADTVAVASIPLGPDDGEPPHVVAPFAHVPGFGDQLDLREDRVLVDHIEEPAHAIDITRLASQRRREIEAKPVDVHFGDPVPQAVHNQLQHAGMTHPGGVAAPGEIAVLAAVVVHQVVVRTVVDAAEREGGAPLVSLGGVVVNHVENDLDARGVQGPDHRLEFDEAKFGVGLGTVAGLEGEVTEGVVAPVIGPSLLEQEGLIDMKVDGKQLDGGDTKSLEVSDGGFGGEAGVGAAEAFGNLRHEAGEALHVQFVDDGLFPGGAERAVFAPGESGVDDLGERRPGGRVAGVEGEVFVGVVDFVAEERVVPLHSSADGSGVGVEQQLVRIAAMAPLGVVGAVDAVAVEGAGTDVGEVAVEDVEGPFGKIVAGRFDAIVRVVEEAQFDAGSDLGEEGEVDACAIPGGSEWLRLSGPDTHCDGSPCRDCGVSAA